MCVFYSLTQKIIFLVILFASLSMQAKKRKSTSSASLYGTYELVQQYTDSSIVSIRFKPTEITFDKKDNRMSANVGCNSIGGSMNVNGNNVQFSQLLQTKMFCEGEPNEIESHFTQNLQAVNMYKFQKNGQLALYRHNILLIVLKRK